jgi:hypothetical protein
MFLLQIFCEVGRKSHAKRYHLHLYCSSDLNFFDYRFVVCLGDSIHVTFDGWKGAFDYWCRYTNFFYKFLKKIWIVFVLLKRFMPYRVSLHTVYVGTGTEWKKKQNPQLSTEIPWIFSIFFLLGGSIYPACAWNQDPDPLTRLNLEPIWFRIRDSD